LSRGVDDLVELQRDALGRHVAHAEAQRLAGLADLLRQRGRQRDPGDHQDAVALAAREHAGHDRGALAQRDVGQLCLEEQGLDGDDRFHSYRMAPRGR
jgi:hypothetical protein